ncbi:MAG: histidine--tRNA ligase [Alphaproteobacteria bacterium]|nr:histidine--tRNA ligase [Alphaproteobacteria bacterium]
MSSDKKSVYKPKPISGFPEWLPEFRAVEQKWMDHLRRVFESYGYCSIETPAVEELEVLQAKGEVDKEIYVLNRVHADPNEKSDARLALHFDQTVPLARYVAQHFGNLTFPFKRYQMQKVWRGERPQLGRLREFYQCDIDVIGVDQLPLAFDAEMPAVMYEALTGLNVGRVQVRISNRKILLGLVEALGIADSVAVTRTVDKIEKIGDTAVADLLQKEVGMDAKSIDAVLQLAKIKGDAAAIKAITPQNKQMEEGVSELAFVMSAVPAGSAIADLSIVRGLDYYTGTVYETALLDIPQFTGSVCSGGRYDDLAGSYINRHLPGVGISIGFTRLFDVLSHYGHIKPGPKCPTQVLVVLPSEEKRAEASATAATLRKRGLNVELYHAPQNVKKQMEYANKKGIPFVWFPPFDAAGNHEVKDMASGAQGPADPNVWKI